MEEKEYRHRNDQSYKTKMPTSIGPPTSYYGARKIVKRFIDVWEVFYMNLPSSQDCSQIGAFWSGWTLTCRGPSFASGPRRKRAEVRDQRNDKSVHFNDTRAKNGQKCKLSTMGEFNSMRSIPLFVTR